MLSATPYDIIISYIIRVQHRSNSKRNQATTVGFTPAVASPFRISDAMDRRGDSAEGTTIINAAKPLQNDGSRGIQVAAPLSPVLQTRIMETASSLQEKANDRVHASVGSPALSAPLHTSKQKSVVSSTKSEKDAAMVKAVLLNHDALVNARSSNPAVLPALMRQNSSSALPKPSAPAVPEQVQLTELCRLACTN
jgi:hypothetical protein